MNSRSRETRTTDACPRVLLQCPVMKYSVHIPQVCATQYSVHIPQVATQYARVQDDVWVEAVSSKVRLQQAAAGRHGATHKHDQRITIVFIQVLYS